MLRRMGMRGSLELILYQVVVLNSTSYPENMSPQLHLGVKLSPMLVFATKTASSPRIPIVNYYRNRWLDAVLGAKNQRRR